MAVDVLPVVSPEVSGPVQHQLAAVEDGVFVRESLRRLRQSNPVLALWVEGFSKETRDRRGAAVCALVLYRLLESQAEANKLMSEYGPPD